MGEDDDLFGRLAVEQGLVKPAQLDECVRLRGELERAGVRPAPTVGELLVRKGYLTPQQAQDTMRLTRASGSSRPGSPEPPAEAVEAGKTPINAVGKYVRTAKIGTGGMGEVWRAWDRELGRWVALKFLRGDDPDELTRFEREAQTAAKLSHPNIAAVHEVGQHAGRPFIAMQLIEGESLAAFPRGDRRLLAEVVREAALAVHHAHEQGVIHRDLKPHNIMVEGAPVAAPRSGSSHRSGSARLRVYVLDFGLAKHAAVNSSVSVSGSIVGTPSYMPPEQARGAQGRADARSDVYSLGATLYDVLAGRPPFQEESLAALLMKLIREDPQPLRRADPKIDPDLETIVSKCLEKDPERRYPTALALAEDLGRWLEGEPIVARPPSLGYRVRKRLVKHAALSVAITAAVVAALVAAGIFVHGALRRASEREAALAELERRADSLLREAEGAFGRKDWGRAQEKLGQFLVLRPGDARAGALKRECEEQLALIRKEAEDKPRALKAAEFCRRALDHVKEARVLLRTRSARREQWEKHFDEAARSAASAIELYPTLAASHSTQGEIHQARGRLKEAVAAYDAALGIDPEMAEAYQRRGLCHLELYLDSKESGRVRSGAEEEPEAPGPGPDLDGRERAMADFARFKDLRGDRAENEVARQLLQVALALADGRPADAERWCDEILRESATDELVWLFKARAQINQKKAREARETLDRLLQDVVPHLSRGYFVRAQVRSQAGDVPGGLADWDQAVSLDPENPLLYFYRGSLKGGSGDWKGDVEDCTRAIDLSPTFAAAWSNRSVARSMMGDRERALQDALRAAALDPRQALIQNTLGNALARVGRHAEGIEALTRAIELDPTRETFFLTSRGRIKRETDDAGGANEDFARALRLDPKNYDAQFFLAETLRDLKRPKESVEAYTKAMAIRPKNVGPYEGRGFARRDAGDRDGALKDFSEAITRGTRKSTIFNQRGTLLWHKGEHRQALSDFEKAVELDPKHELARANLAISRAHQGDPRGAVAEWDALLVLNPDYRHAHAKRGRAKWSLNDFEGALADARKATELNPDDADAWAVLGASRSRLRDPAGAEQDCTKAIRIDKDHTWARFNRGEARSSLGKWKEAAEDFDGVIDRDAGNSYAWFGRGRALLRMGEPARALADLKRSVELSADRKGEAAPLIAECEKALGEK